MCWRRSTGDQDEKNIRKVTGLALLIALVGSLFFVIPSVMYPSAVMRIFTNSQGAIQIGAVYLAVAALSYPFTALTNIYVAMLRAVGRVKAPVMISCMTILINITLNYVLIFGHFGAPRLGAQGAAIATLTARIVESGAILGVVYLTRSPIAGRFGELFGYGGAFVRQFVGTASPVIANEFIWGLGTTMYSLAYGRMGDNAVASITIARIL